MVASEPESQMPCAPKRASTDKPGHAYASPYEHRAYSSWNSMAPAYSR